MRIRQIFLGKKKKPTLFQLNQRKRAQEKDPHYLTFWGKCQSSCLFVWNTNQGGRGAHIPASPPPRREKLLSATPFQEHLRDELFCETTGLGAHLPASRAEGVSTPEDSEGLQASSVPSGRFQNELWVVPFCTEYI